jgi:hypothetical protein
VEFSSHHCFYKLSHSWLLGSCRCSCLLHPACLLTVPWGIAHPPPPWHSGHPALFAICLFCCYCLLLSFFFFFPWVWVGLSRRLCWSGPGLSVGVPCAALITWWSVSSQDVWALPSHGGMGALLVSSFNVDLGSVRGLGVWRSQSFASSRSFSCKVYLQCLSKILL